MSDCPVRNVCPVRKLMYSCLQSTAFSHPIHPFPHPPSTHLSLPSTHLSLSFAKFPSEPKLKEYVAGLISEVIRSQQGKSGKEEGKDAQLKRGSMVNTYLIINHEVLNFEGGMTYEARSC